MNKNYQVSVIIEIRAKDLKTAFEKLDWIRKRKKISVLKMDYAGATKK